MIFRTEIDIARLPFGIDYTTSILSMGSCFAERIVERLRRAKFRATISPTGILFNPASIAQTLTAFAEGQEADGNMLVEREGGWVSLMAHSAIAGNSREEVLSTLSESYKQGKEALQWADTLILTFGTAWVYTLPSGEVVANCQKVPQRNFLRRRLSVTEIVEMFRPLLGGVLSDKNVIFTVSPVRHIGDGLAENSLSKATLRVAIEELCAEFKNAYYFPAYECLVDDLRDYRFYATDMIHPSEQAVEYIWEKFTRCALTPQALELLPRVNKVITAAAHRPTNPHSAEYADFCRRTLDTIASMPEVDFSEEKAHFLSKLKSFTNA